MNKLTKLNCKSTPKTPFSVNRVSNINIIHLINNEIHSCKFM